MTRQFLYTSEWLLEATPEALWPLIADTNRFDRDTGLPPVHMQPPDGENPLATHYGFRLFGLLPVAWSEEPFEWAAGRWFSTTRNYTSGPIRQLRVRVELSPRPEGGSRMVYRIWATPANLMGRVGIPIKIGILACRAFEKQARAYDRMAATRQAPRRATRRVRLSPDGLTILQNRLDDLRGKVGNRWLDRLRDAVTETDDLMASRLRPHALADEWGAPRREILELFLHATRAGILNMRWDLLCPSCRGAKSSQNRLRDVVSTVHCESCRIDYTVDFDRSVEITFSPNAAIRPSLADSYCAGAPQRTPHILCQQILDAGESRTFELDLPPGRYRLRTNNGGQNCLFETGGEADALEGVAFTLMDYGWRKSHHKTQTGLTFRNETGERRLFILETPDWDDTTVTAATVTSLQTFRDLFSSEALRPDENISVGNLTILFTDLKDSTALYQRIGDAPAFGSVMSHFDVLKAAIDAEEGGIVKTMGDAVMAVFSRPANAVRAVLKAQDTLSAGTLNGQRFVLKAGVHCGPCIAVNLNERLDYFGSAVNLAARLQALSRGNDLILSSEAYADPEVKAMFQQAGRSFELFARRQQLKGFENRQFNVWQVCREERQSHRGGLSPQDLEALRNASLDKDPDPDRT